jgi:energy-converting hydrogenase A subunit M
MNSIKIVLHFSTEKHVDNLILKIFELDYRPTSGSSIFVDMSPKVFSDRLGWFISDIFSKSYIESVLINVDSNIYSDVTQEEIDLARAYELHSSRMYESFENFNGAQKAINNYLGDNCSDISEEDLDLIEAAEYVLYGKSEIRDFYTFYNTPVLVEATFNY